MTRSKFTEVAIQMTSISPGNVLNQDNTFLPTNGLRVTGTRSHTVGAVVVTLLPSGLQSLCFFIYCAEEVPVQTPQAR